MCLHACISSSSGVHGSSVDGSSTSPGGWNGAAVRRGCCSSAPLSAPNSSCRTFGESAPIIRGSTESSLRLRSCRRGGICTGAAGGSAHFSSPFVRFRHSAVDGFVGFTDVVGGGGGRMPALSHCSESSREGTASSRCCVCRVQSEPKTSLSMLRRKTCGCGVMPNLSTSIFSNAVSRWVAIAEFVLYSASDVVRLCPFFFSELRKGKGMWGRGLLVQELEAGEDMDGGLLEALSLSLPGVPDRWGLKEEGGASRLGRGETVGKNRSSSMSSRRPPGLRTRRTSVRTNFQRAIGMQRVRLAIRTKSKELSAKGREYFTLAHHSAASALRHGK